MDFTFSEEQRMFRDTVYRYAKEEITPLCEDADLKGEFSFEVWNKIVAMGLTGLPFAEELGGAGADFVTCSLASEAMAHAGVDGGHMLALGAHTYLCGATINDWGTQEQKKKYIPKIASGEWIGCMGLTEPGAGSDAASLRTTAVKRGDKYILNGSKTFITNAPLAQVMVVYATLDRSLKHKGITAFILERDFPGFSTGQPFHKMGCRASATSEVFFEDCEVPVENCLGGEYKGWNMALGTVEWDRSVLLAPGVGGAMFTLEQCIRYANERHQFGRPIRDFQAIQHRIANIKIFLEAIRLAVYRVASSKDNGQMINPLIAAVNKLYMGDEGCNMAADAIMIHGGYGLMHEYPVEWGYRDAPLGAIGGGTSDIMRLVISRLMLG